MDLRLYSTGSAAPPQAAHVVPGGMKIGPSLPLVRPQAPRAVPSEVDGLRELQRQSGKLGRMLLYWGCGEKAGAGQPFVLDLNAILQGKFPAGLAALRNRRLDTAVVAVGQDVRGMAAARFAGNPG